MVERRVSSGGADLTSENFANSSNQIPDSQERLQAVARLIEMANEIGVEVPMGATLDEVQHALIREESFLQEQIQSANSAYDEYVQGESYDGQGALGDLSEEQKTLVDELITNRIPLPADLSAASLRATLEG